MSTFAHSSPVEVVAAPRPGELQLWSLHVEHTHPLFDAAAALLSADERERMSRMRPGVPREEAILARATLRALLGRMIGCAPQSVPLTTSVHGKPQLDPRHTASEIHFNVAHSHGYVLMAFTQGVAVGVDIERIDPKIEATDIAGQNFAPAEQQAIASASAEDRASIFAAIWVRKEAVLKAHGAGLLLPLGSFSVSHDTSTEHPVPLQDSAGHLHQFFLSELPAPAGFAAALAAAQPGLQHHARQLTNVHLAQLFAPNRA